MPRETYDFKLIHEDCGRREPFPYVVWYAIRAAAPRILVARVGTPELVSRYGKGRMASLQSQLCIASEVPWVNEVVFKNGAPIEKRMWQNFIPPDHFRNHPSPIDGYAEPVRNVSDIVDESFIQLFAQSRTLQGFVRTHFTCLQELLKREEL